MRAQPFRGDRRADARRDRLIRGIRGKTGLYAAGHRRRRHPVLFLHTR